MPVNRKRIKHFKKLADRFSLSQRDPLIRLGKKYPKGTGEGNSARSSLARFIRRKKVKAKKK